MLSTAEEIRISAPSALAFLPRIESGVAKKFQVWRSQPWHHGRGTGSQGKCDETRPFGEALKKMLCNYSNPQKDRKVKFKIQSQNSDRLNLFYIFWEVL